MPLVSGVVVEHQAAGPVLGVLVGDGGGGDGDGAADDDGVPAMNVTVPVDPVESVKLWA